MSIGGRATHVISAMLVVVVAFSGSARASVDRTTHCLSQDEDCHDVDVLTCCGPSAPIPFDRVLPPWFASSPVHVRSAAPMDCIARQMQVLRTQHVPSTQWVRVLDLQVLHQSFVI